MTTSPSPDHEKARSTILMRFQRRGGPTLNTVDFRSLSAADQQEIGGSAQLAAQELPIVLSRRDDHSWLLVTSQRIVWKNGLSVDSIKGGQLEAIISPATPNDPRKVLLSPGGIPLAIRIVTSRGQTVELPVEADKTAYAAMHYVLTFVLEAGQLKQAAPAAKAK